MEVISCLFETEDERPGVGVEPHLPVHRVAGILRESELGTHRWRVRSERGHIQIEPPIWILSTAQGVWGDPKAQSFICLSQPGKSLLSFAGTLKGPHTLNHHYKETVSLAWRPPGCCIAPQG